MTIPEYSAASGARRDTTPKRNKWSIAAFVAAVTGFIFGCIPGALIIGWVLLPVAFVLGIVSAILPGKKTLSIWAIVLSVAGGIVSAFVFISVAAGAISDALDEAAATPNAPMSAPVTPSAENELQDEPQAQAGSREDPLPIGATISGKAWDVVVNSVNLAGNEAVQDANQFNEAPEADSGYIVVNLTATYKGEGSSIDGNVAVAYVTATGEVVNSFDTLAVPPEPAFGMSELYAGASSTGNIVLQVPDPIDGILRVTPGLLEGEVFVSIQ